jgi:Tfp pilus assembly protein PilX
MNKNLKDVKNIKCEGFVLPAVLVLLLLFTGASVGLIYMASNSMSMSGSDLDNTQAFYGAEAGMEMMMADLSSLFSDNQSPTVTEIQDLAESTPQLDGINYSEYEFEVPNQNGVPISTTQHISSGSNEGLMAQIVPMTLNITARSSGRSEVKMSRDIEVALIPVFQFGIFSDSDLSYFPGPSFDFAGRVHTNGNLFLAANNSITFHSKISAAEDIIRKEMANGEGTSGRSGAIKVPRAAGGCDGSKPACRNLAMTEGSKIVGPDSADNPNWINISTSVYNGLIVDGDTGAKELELPFVSDDMQPIEIIRRPDASEVSGSSVSDSRLYNKAQIRILISDSAGEIAQGTVRLSNEAPYYDGSSYGATNTAFAEGRSSWNSDFVKPAGSPTKWPLVDGYLCVEHRLSGGTFENVTEEWLDLGIARENPNAILKFQTIKFDPTNGTPLKTFTNSVKKRSKNFYPINVYDSREGEVRDISLGSGNTTGAVGGIMNVIELDVSNLKRWISGSTGSTGSQTEYLSQNGYILYFSDRRGMQVQDGTYGYEDIVNPSNYDGAPNNLMDAAEDVNGDGTLNMHGAANLGEAFGVANGSHTSRVDLMGVGYLNKVSGARHGLKLVNGGLDSLPAKPDGTGGFTVASENPVYIQGNYNADSSGFTTTDNVNASVIADSVTLLSNNWQDWQSFKHPTYVGSSTVRNASETWYRLAIAAGKNINFDYPGYFHDDFGTDGGTHNFLRYLERWSSDNCNYKGSMVSLYYSQYGSGIYKCCSTVYTAPQRNYSFDDSFLDPANMPPGTPMFRDIVNLGFRQVFIEEHDN